MKNELSIVEFFLQNLENEVNLELLNIFCFVNTQHLGVLDAQTTLESFTH